MKNVYFLDTNVIIRFLLQDNKILFKKAKAIFKKAENGFYKLYIDEIVVAECIWLLSSFYKSSKEETIQMLIKIISFDFVICDNKNLLIDTMMMVDKHNLSFVDCWLNLKSKVMDFQLITFDKKLNNICK